MNTSGSCSGIRVRFGSDNNVFQIMKLIPQRQLVDTHCAMERGKIRIQAIILIATFSPVIYLEVEAGY